MILVRSLAHRAGTTIALLVVALCSVAAAVAGPTYNAAARQSILRDGIVTSPTLGHTLEVNAYGPVTDTLPKLSSYLVTELRALSHGQASVDRLFGAGVSSLETQSYVGAKTTSTTLVWFSAACADVRLVSGACPTATNQVMLSRAFANAAHFRLHQGLKTAVGTVTVAGIYIPQDPNSPVWYDRGTSYFPQEIPCAQGGLQCPTNTYDAMFTTRATLGELAPSDQGEAIIDRPLNVEGVRVGDIPRLERISDQFLSFSEDEPIEIQAQTEIDQTISTIRVSWRKLSVPIVVVTAELLALIWILMFVLVLDANEARAGEIALAKLRGFSRLRMLRFALGEPTALLLTALPLGTVLGWLAARILAAHQLRAGTSVHLVAIGWLFGALATIGGLVPVVGGARGILRRSVIEQWRRTPQQGGRRGWVLDAVVGTAAVLGLAQLLAGGHLNSSSKSPVALLVPALLGIAVAITSSRLLPLVCRSLYARTRSRGGLGAYLAVRHIGRRPAAMRTMVILATAMALATFGIASYSVGHANRTRAAELTVGAPTVLTVNPRLGVDVATAVDRADPSGTHAVAVQRATEGAEITLAVQPQRFAAVAHWGAAGVGNAGALLQRLNSPSPPPLVLRGSQVRVSVSASNVSPPDSSVSLNVVAVDSTGPSPLLLGRFSRLRAAATSTQDIPSDDSTVVGFELDPPVAPFGGGAEVTGVVTITRIQVRTATGWQDVPGALDPNRWQATGAQISSVQSAPAGIGGLQWTVTADKGSSPTLLAVDRPANLPAIAAKGVASGQATFAVTGLDGSQVGVAPVAQLSGIPGAPDTGVVVNVATAERASYGVETGAVPQVWVRGDPAPIEAALNKQGVTTLSTQSSGDLAALYSRQGPGLASVIFATDAVIAALLAAFGAVLSLIVAARRRRHEYAAMTTAGVSRRALYAAMAIEQLVVTGVAAVVGVVAGVVATALIERDIPEFVGTPAGIMFHYGPPVTTVLATVGGSVVLLLAVVAIGVWMLLRSIDPEQLRSAAP